jgi:class 3 adenylate cyclase
MQDDSTAASGRKPSLERRLATILMADVAGYSKMVGENEERTIEVLRGHREIFDEILRSHRGRIFNTAGDAILAEFPSAVDAVRCATEVQAALRTRNDHLAPEQRMMFRVGINLGDVIVQGSDLLGDGVNVAARIQTVAAPGGICISGSVYDQIQNKLSLQFRQLGEQTFKNIAQPIRTFSITDSEDGALAFTPKRRGARSPMVVAAAGIVTMLVAGAAYLGYREHESQLAEQLRIADAQRKADQDRLAAAAAQQESKLQAELQATKDALQQAEASKRKSELDRVAAESARREARLQGELNAAKDALAKSTQSKKGDPEAKGAVSTPPAVTLASVAPKETGAAKGASARFDGSYKARFCNYNESKGGTTRCWNAVIVAAEGKLSSTWPSKASGNPVLAKGTIAPDGGMRMTIEGFLPDGRPLRGTVSGTWASDKFTLAGSWHNGVGLSADVARAQ